ncbi:MAG: LptE family protein [Spirochaetota bacterium]
MFFVFLNKKILITAAFSFIVFLSGCVSDENRKDHSVKDVLKNFKGEPVVPRQANKISVPVFNNLTGLSSISEELTVKLREQIRLDGRLAVVSENENADLILSGIIKEYQVQGLEYNGFDKPVKKRLRITASVKLFDMNNKNEIFYEKEIQAFKEFSEIKPPISSETLTLEKVLDDLAGRIAFKTINGWYTELMTPAEKGKK